MQPGKKAPAQVFVARFLAPESLNPRWFLLDVHYRHYARWIEDGTKDQERKLMSAFQEITPKFAEIARRSNR